MKQLWIAWAIMMTGSALADVSWVEKQQRIHLLESLPGISSFNIEAYRRDLQYETQALSLEERARQEANLLTTKIRSQIILAYDAALVRHQDAALASDEVSAAIHQDLELADPAIRDEIRNLSLDTLNGLQVAGSSTEVSMEKVEKMMLKGVTERAVFLNEPTEPDPQLPSANRSKDSEKLTYGSKMELLQAIVSDRENARWVSTAHQVASSGSASRVDRKISLQVKAEFLGTGLEIGPQITFKREYSTDATVMAEGLAPVLMADGNFDFHKRDQTGKILVKAGKKQRRFAVFYCSANLNFETDYSGSGGFTLAGMGSNVTLVKNYRQALNMISRRILIPEYVGNQTVTMRFLGNLCHHEYLRGRVNNKLSVAESLNVMMKNVVNGLRFSHPKTKCAIDRHCAQWFKKDVISLLQKNNVPRCLQEKREGYMGCEVRGLSGQRCPIPSTKSYIKKTFEFECDRGLTCVEIKRVSLLSPIEGRCMPIKK